MSPRFPYKFAVATLILLVLAQAAAAICGVFAPFNDRGILSGPFSALMLGLAISTALLILVVLDWKVWLPHRIAKTAAVERWLCIDVLSNGAAAKPDWRRLSGRFRNRTVILERSGERPPLQLTFQMACSSALELKVVRLEEPAKEPAPASPFSSGDADFEERYAWQSSSPETIVPLLQRPRFLEAIKRLASLVAMHGQISDANAGLSIIDGRITVRQAPAPALTDAPEEILLVLHDLSIVAMPLEDAPPPMSQPGPAVAAAAPASWMILGCGGFLIATAWLGGSYLLSRLLGLPAAMAGFFVPPLALGLLVIIASAGHSGRDPNIEDKIKSEAERTVRDHGDLYALIVKFRDGVKE